MVDDNFALEKFRKLYSHYFVEVRLHKGANGETEILGMYNKPRFKRDWIPNHFCRRPVRCVRIETAQPATPTPAVGA
ncbi:MAG: hypothetical protein KDB07_02375 [Planctomycetes bacterium]|nr:hypothetical protein [Planctomycetota bacterium]